MSAPSYDETLDASARRDHGVHYTPEEMAAEVVAHAIDRLFIEHQATSNFIRSLRVGDMAMGGGVFIIETIRYLSTKLIAAWEREGIVLHDPQAAARHCVAEECVFGIELDPLAAANARAAVAAFVGSPEDSLGLEDCLRVGDALVGLSGDQINALDWEPAAALLPAVREANSKDTKLAGDCVLGAFFAHPKKAARRKELTARQPVILAALGGDTEAREKSVAWQTEMLAAVPAFHWSLELPFLFSTWSQVPTRINAFVGNPPFVGGKKISGIHGKTYCDWLAEAHPNCGGAADLCAHFFRRGFDFLGRGTFGLIATQSISQGYTREGGLKVIVDEGGRIFRAHVAEKWPGTASVTVSTVFVSKHGVAPDSPCFIRDRRAP